MPLPRLLPVPFVLTALLLACSPPPEFEAGKRPTPSDQPVVLLPLDEVLAQARGGEASDTSAADLAARAARLRARAGANQ